MILEKKPLASLTARDLMNRDVVTISQEMSLRDAAQLLAREFISGAPVVDDEGKCVGILSAVDFLLPWFEEKGKGPTRVGQLMTPDPVVVEVGTSLSQMIQMMLDAHIHRLIVVDKGKRPVGVVSSTNVLAAIHYSGELE